MKILFAGGGTAGHINPAIAIAKHIQTKHPDWEILFVGTEQGLEKKLVPKAGFSIRYIHVKGFKRQWTLDILITIKALFKGMMEAKQLLKAFKPDIVVGTGGYVSGPVVLRAAMMKIPTLIHEQNVFPGITIKILSRFANVVAISFKESKKYLKVKHKLVHTGNPIKKEIIDTDRERARASLGLDKRPFILVFGGSLGADKINKTLVEYIPFIYQKKSIQLMAGTGEKQYDAVIDGLQQEGIDPGAHQDIKVFPYIYNMDEALAAADLVVCRAGAITLSELTAMGKPSILIPSPNVTNNHQEYNARVLEKHGAAVVLTESDLNGTILYNQIDTLLQDKSLLRKMSKNSLRMGITNAAEKIYNIIMELLNGSEFGVRSPEKKKQE